jgi:hypothetical protein
MINKANYTQVHGFSAGMKYLSTSYTIEKEFEFGRGRIGMWRFQLGCGVVQLEKTKFSVCMYVCKYVL